jgi:hypothetical protein
MLHSPTILRAPKRGRFSLIYGVVSNNLKTGIVYLNKEVQRAIGAIRSIKI